MAGITSQPSCTLLRTGSGRQLGCVVLGLASATVAQVGNYKEEEEEGNKAPPELVVGKAVLSARAVSGIGAGRGNLLLRLGGIDLESFR